MEIILVRTVSLFRVTEQLTISYLNLKHCPINREHIQYTSWTDFPGGVGGAHPPGVGEYPQKMSTPPRKC